jgi:hypothetical protein
MDRFFNPSIVTGTIKFPWRSFENESDLFPVGRYGSRNSHRRHKC